MLALDAQCTPADLDATLRMNLETTAKIRVLLAGSAGSVRALQSRSWIDGSRDAVFSILSETSS
jgi:hypothetical protein